jgi:hypothetical protein
MILLSTMMVFAQPVSACHWRKKPKDEINGIFTEYDDVNLTGGFSTGHFDDIWNLTAGELKITFTYDATGLVDEGFDPETFLGTMAIGQLGVRDTSASDMEPFEKGVWLNTLYDIESDTFDPDKIIDTDLDNIPDTKADKIFDLDDQLMLQRGGPYWDETDYDLPSGSGNPYTSYGIWFDRDGVNTTQTEWWGFNDGGIYNTGGVYYVELLIRATGDTSGEAFLTINGIQQGFWVDEWSNFEPEMYPAGMTFSGDMRNMQIFYGLIGFGAIHKISFTDIKVVQAIEHDLVIDIDINIDESTIQSIVDTSIPDNIEMYFELDVNPKIGCDDTIIVDIIAKININENVKVNVDLNIDISVISADEDVELDIDLFVKDAGDVRIDGIFNIKDVENDANIDFAAIVKNSKNVWVNFDSDIQDINDDAKTKVKIVVKNSGDVSIDVNPKVIDIADDSKVWVKIKIKNSNDINLNIDVQVKDINDDSKIWVKVRGWNNNEIIKNVSAIAQNIGDKSKICKSILIW